MAQSTVENVKASLSGLKLAIVELLYSLANSRSRRSKSGARYCFPGQEWVANRLGVSRRSVNHAVSSLRRLGILEVINRRKKDGRWQTNLYKVVNCQSWWRFAIMDIWKRGGRREKEASHIENPQKEIITVSESEPDRPKIQGVLADLIRALDAKPPAFSFKS